MKSWPPAGIDPYRLHIKPSMMMLVHPLINYHLLISLTVFLPSYRNLETLFNHQFKHIQL